MKKNEIKIQKKIRKSISKNITQTVMQKWIPKDKYFAFLDYLVKKHFLGNCQYKDEKKNYLSTSKIDFYENYSNSIVRSYIEYMKKEKKLYLFSRLYILLIHFVSEETSFKILKELRKSSNFTDVEFIQMFSKLTPNEKKPGIYELKDSNNNSSSCHERLYVFKTIHDKYQQHFKNLHGVDFVQRKKIHPSFRYLDIGCGNGSKTELFADLCKIPINQVYGADVAEWGPYKSNRKFKFHYQQIFEDNLLQFPDKYFQIITCFLTLHHVESLPSLLKEIHRVLDNKGILLIIDHIAFNVEDSLIINIQHMLYSYLRDNKTDMNFYKNYIKNSGTNNYFSYLEWDFLMKEQQLRFYDGMIIFEGLSHFAYYDNQFYAFYIKN